MRFSNILLSMSMLAAMLGLQACGGSGSSGSNYTNGSVTMACDASFQNIMEQEIEVFEYRYPNTSVLDRYVSESAAIDSLLNGSVKMAVTSRPLDKKEIAYIRGQKLPVSQAAIAVDAIALIVNPSNPLDEIDCQDLEDILRGKYTTWDKIVPNAKQLGDIAVVFDGNGSSTIRYMRDSLLNGDRLGPNAFAKSSPREVFDAVAKSPNAIGVIGVSWVTGDLSDNSVSVKDRSEQLDSEDPAQMADFNSAIKVLAVQPKGQLKAYMPNQLNIYSGDYPFHRQIYLISTSVPHTVGHSFYSFVTGAVGQKIIFTTGVCPKMIHAQFVSID